MAFEKPVKLWLAFQRLPAAQFTTVQIGSAVRKKLKSNPWPGLKAPEAQMSAALEYGFSSNYVLSNEG